MERVANVILESVALLQEKQKEISRTEFYLKVKSSEKVRYGVSEVSWWCSLQLDEAEI